MSGVDIITDSLKDMSFLREKCIVDMINTIDVTNDHIQQQKQRSSFFYRLSDSITGNDRLRQIDINKNVQVGLKNAAKLIDILASDITQANNAIYYVHNQVEKIQQHMKTQANYMLNLRQDFEEFKHAVDARFNSLEHRVNSIV